MAGVKPIPDEYHSVQPYLVVDGAEGLIGFLRATFELEDPMRMPRPDGKVGHCEVRIGDSVVMLADSGGPQDAQPTQSMLVVYVIAYQVFKTKTLERFQKHKGIR